VAIYHLNYKSGSRAGGQSGEAKLAYLTRSGKYEAGVDQVLYVEHAHYPTYASSAEEFWKGADEHERVNGRLFVEVEVALPRELDLEQQKELAREMAEWLSYKTPTREQDAASPGPLPYTIALHRGHKDENPHAHILLNERPTDGVQRTMEATFKRVNAAHPERGGAPKSLTYHRPEVVKEIRQEWEIRANAALERAGHEARIDHRSYKEQGVEQEPGVHLGHRASAMERAGVQTERGDEQRAIEERNREREREREAEAERAKQMERERELEQKRQRELADLEKQVKERHELMSSEGFKESSAFNGIYQGTLERAGHKAVLVVNNKSKTYAMLMDEVKVYKVSLKQGADGSTEFVRKAQELSALERGDRVEVRQAPDGEVGLYVGLMVAIERKEQLERERAAQTAREQEERKAAVKREVEAQDKAYQDAGWTKRNMIDGEALAVREVHSSRIIVVGSTKSREYAVLLDPQERTASVELNERKKYEIVMHEAPAPIEKGEKVRCDMAQGYVCSKHTEASFEKQKLQRALERDDGWER
jgi:hypothetical protein